MKRFILSFLIAFGVCLSFAQNWTSETTKAFRKNNNVAVVVDFTNAYIWDMTYDEFLRYNNESENSSNGHYTMLFDRVEKKLSKDFGNSFKKKLVDPEGGVYIIYFIFDNVTEKAGYSGHLFVEIDGNKSQVYKFSCKDGRWNSFDNLLKENIEWLIRFFSQGENPYNLKLHKYSN